jgi:hypothetical protein
VLWLIKLKIRKGKEMKVKMFRNKNCNSNHKDLESEINNWLHNFPSIEIKNITQSESSDTEDFYQISICVWYND